MIQSYKKKSNIAGIVFLIAMIAMLVAASDPGTTPGSSGTASFRAFSFISAWAFIFACWFYIKAKGRSGFWILALLLNVIGLLILALLKDYAKGSQNEDAIGPNRGEP